MTTVPNSFFDQSLDERIAFASSAEITDEQAEEATTVMATLFTIRSWDRDDFTAFTTAVVSNPNLSFATLVRITQHAVVALNERHGDTYLGRKAAPVLEALALNPARELELLAGTLSNEALSQFFLRMRAPLHELLGGIDHIGRRHPEDVAEARHQIEALMAATPISVAPTIMMGQIEALAVFLYERYLLVPPERRPLVGALTENFLLLWEGRREDNSDYDNLLLLDDDLIRARGKSPGATRWHLEYVLTQVFGTGIETYLPAPSFVAWVLSESAYEPSSAVRSWAVG